jgi:hypothetical protein
MTISKIGVNKQCNTHIDDNNMASLSVRVCNLGANYGIDESVNVFLIYNSTSVIVNLSGAEKAYCHSA